MSGPARLCKINFQKNSGAKQDAQKLWTQQKRNTAEKENYKTVNTAEKES